MDFSDVAHPFQNKLDRTKSSRMGWSDIALSFHGPCVSDLRHHFIDRWNFIYDEKYKVRKDVRYSRFGDAFGHSTSNPAPSMPVAHQTPSTSQMGNYPPPPGSQAYSQPAWQSTSRPHTPNTLNPETYPAAQSGSHSPSFTQQQQFPPPPPGPPPQRLDPHFSAPTQTYEQQQHQTQTPTSYQGQQNVYSAQPPQSYPNQPPSPSQNAPEPYITPQAAQPQYAAYGGSDGTPSGQSGQHPYEHPVYQAPAGSSTRGIEEDQSYIGQDRGNGADRGYEGERGFDDQYSSDRGLGGRIDQYKQEGKRFGQELTSFGDFVSGGLQQKAHQYSGKYLGGSDRPSSQQGFGPMNCQILRSCSKWSNGTPTEKSIQAAYIDVIEKSQHFVYIENQFFITATGDKQKPVKNLIGKALVDRILRAARNGEKYKVIVIIPAVPAFAGDLRDDASLGTRAIMEFQYFSINRGGNSIMELIAQAGFNPLDYIRFYNLRNYDRLNAGNTMSQVEHQSGVSYEDARRQHDDIVGAGYAGHGEGTGVQAGYQGSQYQQYQAAAQSRPKTAAGRWDTVAECYMLGGEDIRNVPWDGSLESELDAFVSEELYIHSKVCSRSSRFNGPLLT
jgi:phospholipase D1/2